HPLFARRCGGAPDPRPVEHAAGLPAAADAQGRRVVAAPALEKIVSRRAWVALIATLAAGGASIAGAATRVLVVAGLGGEPHFEERFNKWSEQVAQASATATGDAEQVQRLAGKAARREQIQAALQAAAKEL